MNLMLFSCNSSKLIKREISIKMYIENNFDTYSDIYSEINYQINDLVDKRVNIAQAQIFREYQLDSLIIYNKSRSKLFSTINTKTNPWEIGSSDLIQSLYGVKLNNKWHLYLGANLIALRDGYKTNKYEPFTWQELSHVAHEQMFGRFIGFDENGNMLSKHDMVEKYVNPWDIGGASITHEGTEEERFLRLTAYNQSKKLDSTEYQQLLNEINNPEPKERDPIKKLTWWDKLWGEEVPVFDTKEWKEYIANKNKGK